MTQKVFILDQSTSKTEWTSQAPASQTIVNSYNSTAMNFWVGPVANIPNPPPANTIIIGY
jgi:hypothetical protein